ncbi:MAG: hypothetical protein V3U65_06070 [Granulosicoccaceae bacterium]
MAQIQLDKNQAEIAKLLAETAKASEGIRCYEVVVITVLVVAIITITNHGLILLRYNVF